MEKIKVVGEWPNTEYMIGDIIKLPSEQWKFADNTYAKADFFESWPHLFEVIKTCDKCEYLAEAAPCDECYYTK